MILANLDGSEVFVKLRVQRGQLVDGAVESAVVVTQDLTEEERGKRDVHNDALRMRESSYTSAEDYPNNSAQNNRWINKYTSYMAFPSIFPTNSNSCKWFSWM